MGRTAGAVLKKIATADAEPSIRQPQLWPEGTLT
jgi:hypothetical protein